jgi:hypothetical protein
MRSSVAVERPLRRTRRYGGLWAESWRCESPKRLHASARFVHRAAMPRLELFPLRYRNTVTGEWVRALWSRENVAKRSGMLISMRGTSLRHAPRRTRRRCACSNSRRRSICISIAHSYLCRSREPRRVRHLQQCAQSSPFGSSTRIPSAHRHAARRLRHA